MCLAGTPRRPAIYVPPDATASEADFLLALAQGLTGVLAVVVAALLYFGALAVRRRGGRDKAYEGALLGVACSSLGATVLIIFTWAAWSRSAPDFDLVLGISARTCVATVFGACAVASMALLVASTKVLTTVRQRNRRTDWQA